MDLAADAWQLQARGRGFAVGHPGPHRCGSQSQLGLDLQFGFRFCGVHSCSWFQHVRVRVRFRSKCFVRVRVRVTIFGVTVRVDKVGVIRLA